MELMQKHVKDDGAVGVDDLKLWPSDSNAVDFLSATTSATTVDVLLEVGQDCIIEQHSLISLASFH